MSQSTPLAVQLTGITKRFPGVVANSDINISIRRGTVHALIGPNGSGKTTSLNVVNGIYRPTLGRVVLDGEDVSQMRPHQRASRGLGRTFQNIRLFATLSALENVMIGAQRDNNPIPSGDKAKIGRAHV